MVDCVAGHYAHVAYHACLCCGPIADWSVFGDVIGSDADFGQLDLVDLFGIHCIFSRNIGGCFAIDWRG
jgi:hypothetical protein